MDEVRWASGQWRVKDGRVDEFVERWTAWLTWTRDTIPGFRSAKLLRSETDPLRFVSVSDWDDAEARRTWNTSEGFRERLEPIRALCDEFVGDEFELAAEV